MKKILFYAIGNPGRADDGLGNEFIKLLEPHVSEQSDLKIDFDSNYHLNIEDAELISHYDCVFLIDASEAEIESFEIRKVIPSPQGSFTSHSVSPEYLAELSQELFGETIPIYAVHIKGYKWDLGSPISKKALKNLNATTNFFKNLLHNSIEFSKFTVS